MSAPLMPTKKLARPVGRAKILRGAIYNLGIDLANAKSELRAKQTELEKEQQKTASAQTEAARAQQRANAFFMDRLRWRTADSEKFRVNLAPPVPKAQVELAYKPGDTEAVFFAETISQALKAIGWEVDRPTPYTGPAPLPGQPAAPDALAALTGTRIYFKPDPNSKVLPKGTSWMPFWNSTAERDQEYPWTYRR